MSSEDLKARVKKQLQHYAPEKASQADALLSKYVGKEKQLLDALVKQYGAEPGGGAAASSAPSAGGGGGGGDIKTRIKNQLQKYAPEKAAQADALIAKYAGKEQQLLDALVKQYGPEPSGGNAASSSSPPPAASQQQRASPAAVTTSSSGGGGGGDIKTRIKNQLQKYAPEKAAQADALIAKYAGKEQQLLDALVKQYGPESSSSGGAAAASGTTSSPPPPVSAARLSSTQSPTMTTTPSNGGGGGGDVKTRIKNQLQKYAPEKAAQADALIAKYVGKEQQLLDALVKQYGPESTGAASNSPTPRPALPSASPQTSSPTPAVGGGDIKTRIKNQLQKYAPEKAGQADALIAKYAGKEQQLLDALVKQYGPEGISASPASTSHTSSPVQQQQQQQRPSPVPASSAPSGDIKTRIKNQLQKYAPEKAGQADALIAKYAGKEQQLLDALVKQYGPEASSSSGGAVNNNVNTSSPTPTPAPPIATSQNKSPSNVGGGGGDVANRVKALLQKYAPEKAAQADALLAKYVGKEQQLLDALVKQYGSEPASGVAGNASGYNSPSPPSNNNNIPQQQQPQPQSLDVKTRIKNQLQKYAPEKAGQADALIAKYAGKEQQLLDALVKQYGPEAAPSSISAVSPSPSYQPPPAQTKPISPQQQTATSPPATNNNAMTSASPSGDPVTRIKSMLKYYAPEKSPQADALISKYAGKEQQLLDALVKQYGPEPASSGISASPSTNFVRSPSSSPQQQQQQQQQQPASNFPSASQYPNDAPAGESNEGNYNARVKALLQKYAPEKAAQADALLGKYVGKEKLLLDALVKQYGPEPSTSSSSPQQQSIGKGDDIQPPSSYAESSKNNNNQVSPSTFPSQPPVSQQQQQQQQQPQQQQQSQQQQQQKDYPTRIREMLQHYVPEKASQATALISKYPGKEDLLLESLKKQYGPEPSELPSGNNNNNNNNQQSSSPSSMPSSPTTAPSQTDYAARVKNIIACYAPEKISSVDQLLTQFSGKEPALIEALVNSYGPEPGTNSNNNTNQRSVLSSPSTLPQQQQSPSSPISASPQSTAVGAAPSTIQERIHALVTKYDSSKAPQIPVLLQKFAGQEEKLLDALVKQYGPEPHLLRQQQQQQSGPTITSLESLPMGDRVRRLLKHYAPEREDAQIDVLLTKAAGNEPKILEALVKQFGSEPPLQQHEMYSARSSSPSSGLPVTPQQQQLRDQISRIVREKDGANFARLPALFNRYHGEEQKLLNMLLVRYASEEDQRLIPFPTAEPPSSPRSIPSISDAQNAVQTAEKKAKLRAQLTQIFAANAPHKLGDIDAISDAFYDEPERILGVMRERYNLGEDLAPSPDRLHQQQSNQQQQQQASALQQQQQNQSDVKRIIYLRLENLFRNYCPQKLHETSSVLDAWENAAGYPTSMFKALYNELHVPPEEQSFHAGLDAVMTGGKADPSSLLSKRGVRRNTILGTAGGAASPALTAAQRFQNGLTSDADGVGLAPPASAGTITQKGKLLLRFVAGRSILHRDTDGSLRTPDDPQAAMKSASNIWCGVMYPAGHDVYRSPKMIVDIEGNGEWDDDKTNLCALLVTPGEAPLLTLVVYNDAGFFLGELRLNLQRLPQKSQHSFTLRPRVDERDGLIMSAAARDNGTGLGELEIKWSFSQDRSGASGAGIGVALGITTDGSAGNTKEGLEQMQQQLAGVKTQLNPIRPRIRSFFARYIPEHLHEVPSVLEEYRGRETELLDALCVRFGPEPDPMAFQTRVERIFSDYDPGRVPEARQITQKSVGKEEFVIRTLIKKYGQEPPPNYSLPPVGGTAPHPPSDPSRIRLTRWLMLRLPRRVSEIEYLLTRFETRENVLFRLLAQTTGPEPTDDPPKSSLRSTKIPTPALREYFAKRQAPLFLRWVWNGETQDGGKATQKVTPFHTKFDQFKARLEAFYAHYNPIKMQEVEETLRRWRGREDILFEALVHKYGPEPTAIHGGGGGVARAASPGASSAAFGAPFNSPTSAKQLSLLQNDSRHPLGSTPRAVLQSFYAVHNPSKLPDVDRLIERFAGRESALFGLLESKYGVQLDGKNSNNNNNNNNNSPSGARHSTSPNNNINNSNSGGGFDETLGTTHRERVVKRPPGILFGGGGGGGGLFSGGNSGGRGIQYNGQNNLDSDEDATGFAIPGGNNNNNISNVSSMRYGNNNSNNNNSGLRNGRSVSPTTSYTNFSLNPGNFLGGNNNNVDFRSVSFADRSEL